MVLSAIRFRLLDTTGVYPEGLEDWNQKMSGWKLVDLVRTNNGPGATPTIGQPPSPLERLITFASTTTLGSINTVWKLDSITAGIIIENCSHQHHNSSP